MTIAAGASAPSFVLTDDSGGSVSLSALTQAGPAVLAFFKTTCPTCRLAFPVIGELADRFGDHLPVVAVSQDPLDKARPWLDELGFVGPVLDDATDGYQVSSAFELEAVPTVVVVDGDTTVRQVVAGWDRAGMNDVARALGERTGLSTAPVSTENDGRPPFKPG